MSGLVHGMYRSPEWYSFAAMKTRCHNPRHVAYSRYGGRGIRVCSEWMGRYGFVRFLEHVGRRPPGTELDRIDNSRGYEPGNVRWATRSQQARNRRSAHRLTIRGVTATIADWAEQSGLSWQAIEWRARHGWRNERLLAPVDRAKPRVEILVERRMS